MNSLRKFLEPSQKQKVIYMDNSLEFGKSCEVLSWNHRTSTPYRSEANGIAERTFRRVKEEHQLYYCNPGWMIGGCRIQWNAIAICKMSKDLLADGKTPYERRFGANPDVHDVCWQSAGCPHSANVHSGVLSFTTMWTGPQFFAPLCGGHFGRVDTSLFICRKKKIPFGILPKFRMRQSWNSSIRKESITRNLSWICLDRGRNLERRHSDCWYWRIREVGCIRNLSQKTGCERSPDNTERWRIYSSCDRWFSDIIRKTLWLPRIHSETGTHRKVENLMATGKSFNLNQQKMTQVLDREFNFSCNHFLFHWTLLMSSMSTHTDLDVAQEKRVDDHWKVDGNRNLSDSWTEVSRDLHFWTKLLREDKCGAGGDWQKIIPTTSRPDHTWHDAWTRIGKAAQRRDKQECSAM